MNQPFVRLSARVLASTVVALVCLAGLSVAQEAKDSCVLQLPEFLISNPDSSIRPLFHEDSVDERPKRLSSPPLQYPRAALEDGWSGWVHVAAVIDTNGHVELQRVLDSGVEITRLTEGLKSTARSDREDVLKYRETRSSGSDIQRQFERLAMDLVSESEFRPAYKNGKAVRTVVCLPVGFSIVRRR